jgi:tetratricopeptide (TPR) repeat protein
MLDWIRWIKIGIAEMDYYDVFYIINFIFIISFLYLALTDPNEALSHLGLVVGLIGVLIAVKSIQSSSKQLKEMQIDYWNARGIDDNRKGAELRKQREYDEASLAYEDAIQAFDKASKLDQQNYKTWTKRGNALLARGKHDKAIEAFDRAVELGPQSAKNWNNCGLALYAKGTALKDNNDILNAQSKYDEAIEAFDKAIERDSELFGAWNNKGDVLKDQGDIFKNQNDMHHAQSKYDEAIACYEEAIRLDPKIGRFSYNKAVAIDAKGRYDGAIEAYDRAIELDPKNTTIWLGKGNTLKALGMYEAYKNTNSSV